MYPSKERPVYGVFVEQIKNQLESEGFTFELSVIEGDGKYLFEKIWKYILYIYNSVEAIKKENYDVIYVHYMNHSLLPLILVKKYLKNILVLNAHGGDVFINNKFAALIQTVVSPIIKYANLIVVPSFYYKDIVNKKYNISKRNIIISPSGGINLEKFKPLKINKTKTSNTFTLGYVSRIDKGKGWQIFLYALHEIVKKNKNISVILIGSGKQVKELQKKINILKLESYIEYLGSKPHDQLPQYFNQMDLFIFPTTRKAESLGLVGLEAMACGVPVVGSSIGGLKEYIIEGKSGTLFEPGNYIELADKMVHFIKMSKKEMSEYKNGALEIARKYDSKLVKKHLATTLRKAIATVK